MTDISAPSDWKNPDWNIDCRVNNWRNYATDGLREMWDSFTDDQKMAISHCLQEVADAEEWD